MGNPSEHIGALRWPIRISRNVQTPNVTTGITERYVEERRCYADVQPVGAISFYLGQQLGEEVTHRVVIRWVESPETIDFVFRDTALPDGGVRTERFRVRRYEEDGGRKRYLSLFVELEAHL